MYQFQFKPGILEIHNPTGSFLWLGMMSVRLALIECRLSVKEAARWEAALAVWFRFSNDQKGCIKVFNFA